MVPAPGNIRLAIEFFLYVVAAVAPWFVWSQTISGIAVGIVVASIVVGIPRMNWLLRNAKK